MTTFRLHTLTYEFAVDAGKGWSTSEYHLVKPTERYFVTVLREKFNKM